MAEIAAAKQDVEGEPNSRMFLWETLTENDTGEEVELPEHADLCVQITGDFGGGSVTFEGSNDGSTWAGLNDPTGTAISLSAAGMAQVLEKPRFVRPGVPGGTSVDVDVYLYARANR